MPVRAVVVAVVLIFIACGGNSREKQQAMEECIARGRAYYKEIGSYPTLSDGRRTEAVIRERCERTTTAF